MLGAANGPNLTADLKLVLEATSLGEFEDAFWGEEVDVHNMHNLRPADLFAFVMDCWQVVGFMLYTHQPNGEVWPIGRVDPEDIPASDSETDSYESTSSLPNYVVCYHMVCVIR